MKQLYWQHFSELGDHATYRRLCVYPIHEPINPFHQERSLHGNQKVSCLNPHIRVGGGAATDCEHSSLGPIKKAEKNP